MNNDSTQQLSSQSNTGKDEHSGLLAAASDFARSVLESVQTLAGTTTCKNAQGNCAHVFMNIQNF